MKHFFSIIRLSTYLLMLGLVIVACKNKPATDEAKVEAPLSENDKAYIQQAFNYHQEAMKVGVIAYKALENLTGMELISEESKKQIKAIYRRYQNWEVRLLKVEGAVKGLELDYDIEHPEMLTRKMSPVDQALYQRTLLDTINAIQISLLEFKLKR